MEPHVTAILIALPITFLIASIEVPYKSKASLAACVSWHFLLYTGIMAVGNIAAVLFASTFVGAQLPVALSRWYPFFYAFAGVLAFNGVLSHVNITVFDSKVLTIHDWIRKSLDTTVAHAIDKQVQRDTDVVQKLASNLLAKLSEKDLNTYVAQYLGAQEVTKLDASAAKIHANPMLYKAIALAYHSPKVATSILKTGQPTQDRDPWR